MPGSVTGVSDILSPLSLSLSLSLPPLSRLSLSPLSPSLTSLSHLSPSLSHLSLSLSIYFTLPCSLMTSKANAFFGDLGDALGF